MTTKALVLGRYRLEAPDGNLTRPGHSVWSLAILFTSVVAVGALFPSLGVSTQHLSLATLALIYATAVYGLSLTFGFGGILSVAQGSILGVGGYIAAECALHSHINMWWVFLIGILGATIVNAMLGYAAARVGGHYFVILTFAVGEGLSQLALVWQGVTKGDTGIPVPPAGVPQGLVDLSSPKDIYYLALTITVLTVLILRLVARSHFGWRLVAAKQNSDLAASVGVNVSRVRILAFALSGGFAGAAGVLWAYYERYVAPEQFGTQLGIQLVLMLLLGGSAYVLGPIIGALLDTFILVILGLSPLTNQLVSGCIFILIILLVPGGLAGGVESGLSALTRLVSRLGSAAVSGRSGRVGLVQAQMHVRDHGSVDDRPVVAPREGAVLNDE